MKSKIIAMYLPQFHCIPENDEFWGKGFTDWVSVKKAKPLFEGHKQPREPLDDNYYDLSIEANIEWQAKIAREHGVYGFGVYHYWFNNEKNLLTKPAEIMRDSSTLAMKYFYVWDNCSWIRSWSNVEGNDWAPLADGKGAEKRKGPQVLIQNILGTEPDWENHYNYLREHFHSSNYEKIGNKPVFSIIFYTPEVAKMCAYWEVLAKKDGFDGIVFIFQKNKDVPSQYFQYTYEPHASAWLFPPLYVRAYRKICRKMGIKIKEKNVTIFDYDKVWQKLLDNAKQNKDSNVFLGGFVSYDDSPRRGDIRSKLFVGMTPTKFQNYLSELLEISTNQGKEYLFLTAWNEWGEGAYLEPDKDTGMEYLDALKKATL